MLLASPFGLPINADRPVDLRPSSPVGLLRAATDTASSGDTKDIRYGLPISPELFTDLANTVRADGEYIFGL